MDTFPSLLEHIEILTRVQKLSLKRIVFRKATPMLDFFLSSNPHGKLETYEQLGINVHWFNALINDIYLHVFKN